MRSPSLANRHIYIFRGIANSEHVSIFQTLGRAEALPIDGSTVAAAEVLQIPSHFLADDLRVLARDRGIGDSDVAAAVTPNGEDRFAEHKDLARSCSPAEQELSAYTCGWWW